MNDDHPFHNRPGMAPDAVQPSHGPSDSMASEISHAGHTAQALKQQIGSALLGQSKIIDQVLITLFAGGHALLEGVPGLGKTLLVHAIAKTFNGSFARIQFTPDLMPSDVAGHSIYDMQTGKFRIRKGPVFTNILLADEINRAPAKTQSALLEVMQEYQVTIESTPIALERPFMTLATQNPLEQEGTYPLPEAQLDRFLLKILIDYPLEEDEKLIVKNTTSGRSADSLNVEQVKPVLDAPGLLKLQQITSNIETDDRIIDYAVRITRHTRQWPSITTGAGPRASIALVRAAKAMALLNGRHFVIPDDIKAVALPALRHRILLTPEMEIEGQSADSVLKAMLENIEAPRI